MGVHLGAWGFIPSHSLHSWEHVIDSRVSFLAWNITTPCLGHEPKARVATRMEVYYEHLVKLAKYLQVKAIVVFLTTIFKVGL
jgi:hypothetical protein